MDPTKKITIVQEFKGWGSLFCFRVWGGLRPWNSPHVVGRAPRGREKSRTDGESYHARGHHSGGSVDSSTPRRTALGVSVNWDGLHRTCPYAGCRIRVRALDSG
jgi:hypothetical protein